MKYDAYNKKDIEEMLNDYLKMNKDKLLHLSVRRIKKSI